MDKLDEIVDKRNNKYHKTIRKKPTYAKSGTYIDYGVENKDEYSQFKVGNHVRISKYQDVC